MRIHLNHVVLAALAFPASAFQIVMMSNYLNSLGGGKSVGKAPWSPPKSAIPMSLFRLSSIPTAVPFFLAVALSPSPVPNTMLLGVQLCLEEPWKILPVLQHQPLLSIGWHFHSI